ncbi:hypothetical protein LPJ59_006809, partial [Coemansia sp. RSA 2399]
LVPVSVVPSRSSIGMRWRSALSSQGNELAWYLSGYPKSRRMHDSLFEAPFFADMPSVLPFALPAAFFANALRPEEEGGILFSVWGLHDRWLQSGLRQETMDLAYFCSATVCF